MSGIFALAPDLTVMQVNKRADPDPIIVALGEVAALCADPSRPWETTAENWPGVPQQEDRQCLSNALCVLQSYIKENK